MRPLSAAPCGGTRVRRFDNRHRGWLWRCKLACKRTPTRAARMDETGSVRHIAVCILRAGKLVVHAARLRSAPAQCGRSLTIVLRDDLPLLR